MPRPLHRFLAHDNLPALQDETRVGVPIGSILSASAGALVLRFAPGGRRGLRA